MKTGQVYSVVVCNNSFNLTLKNEAFDGGYWSSSENEMDNKYEKSTVENPSLVARSRRCAEGKKFFPSPPGEASIEAPSQPRERERVSLKSFFQSQSLSRRGEVRSPRSRHSCSVPPPKISGRNSRNARSQDCLQVEKGGSTSSQLPPPHVSKKDLYKFKMENYVFCPVESSLRGSLSMDGGEVRKMDSCRNEESDQDYYEDEYVPVLGSERQNNENSEGLDDDGLDDDGLGDDGLGGDGLDDEGLNDEGLDGNGLNDESLDGESLVGEEVDADDLLQQQGGQKQLQVHIDPAQQQQGNPQNTGQAGKAAGDGHVGTGQQKTKDPDLSSQKKKLLIKIKPGKWGFPDPQQQNSPACLNSFKNYVSDLFQEVAGDESFDWNSQDTQQLLASVIVRVAKKGEPCAVVTGDFDDFHLYGTDEAIAGTNINYDLNLVLTGVDREDPSQHFFPVTNMSSGQKLDCGLRHAQVLAYQMINDLNNKNIEVEVQYKHTEDANGQATVITYSDNLIKNTVGPALGAVADVLHEIFQFQQWSFSLADAIRDVGEECLDNLEQLTTECTLGKASALDNLKKEAMAAAENLFDLKKTFRQ